MTVIGASLGSSSDAVIVEDKSFLTINLSKTISEQATPAAFDFGGGSESSYGLFEMIRAIDQAATDKKIIGIYLKCGASSAGWATSSDLRDALVKFKQSKKPIYAYGDYLDQKTLYIASVADSLFANPTGMVELKGLAATSMFYKGSLEKLDVKPTIFYCGKYKGASEPYRLDKYSDANREQLGALIGDLYKDMCTTLAQRSGKTPEQIDALAQQYTIRRPADALQQKLIDGLAYEGEVLSKLKKLSGVNDKYSARLANMAKYCKSISKGSGTDKVAVIFAEGEIADGKAQGNAEGIFSETLIKDIRAAANNDKIKAVVLRINSPGGSAMASENIYQELVQLRKKKPIIVSMGDVAASGGYYMSCAGDSIFAQPNTITGSIGVVGIMFGIEGFLKNKLGVSTDAVKTGPYADFPNLSRNMSAQETALIQEFLDSTYVTFKTRVGQARKMDLAAVENIAQGHVYTGADAKDLKLVDGFASLEQCIAKAAQLAKLSKYRLVTYPVKQDGVQAFLNQLQNNESDAKLKAMLGNQYNFYKDFMNFQAGTNKVMARMPFNLEIK
jgi:protease IV